MRGTCGDSGAVVRMFEGGVMVGGMTRIGEFDGGLDGGICSISLGVDIIAVRRSTAALWAFEASCRGLFLIVKRFSQESHWNVSILIFQSVLCVF